MGATAGVYAVGATAGVLAVGATDGMLPSVSKTPKEPVGIGMERQRGYTLFRMTVGSHGPQMRCPNVSSNAMPWPLLQRDLKTCCAAFLHLTP